MSLALHDADAIVDDLLDLARAASGADRVALLLLEDDGSLACRALRGAALDEEPEPIALSDPVLEALEGDAPVVVDASPSRPFPPGWRVSIGGQSVVLAPLTTPEGPLGLLALGWDAQTAADAEVAATRKAAASVARVLDAAITAEVERSRALWREAALGSGREPAGRVLAAIYLRAGLLRLGLDDVFAEEAEEIEGLARSGLAALRRSEESLTGSGTLSGELLAALVDLTDE